MPLEVDKDEKIQMSVKRKWQIALRRYLTENNPATQYAPFFGLPSVELRRWIELQFEDDMTWANFGRRWNLSQRVPLALFDLTNPNDQALCWHFLNITAQSSEANPTEAAKALFSTKAFFQGLLDETGSKICSELIRRIDIYETISENTLKPYVTFLKENSSQIQSLVDFDSDDFHRLNKGEKIQEILTEKAIIKKYGS